MFKNNSVLDKASDEYLGGIRIKVLKERLGLLRYQLETFDQGQITGSHTMPLEVEAGVVWLGKKRAEKQDEIRAVINELEKYDVVDHDIEIKSKPLNSLREHVKQDTSLKLSQPSFEAHLNKSLIPGKQTGTPMLSMESIQEQRIAREREQARANRRLDCEGRDLDALELAEEENGKVRREAFNFGPYK